ncbi:hypothetical protein A2334_02900 [Candidatus Roizmanbacteria bacterium RIFOXYB2_FULL_38_10]|uniref:DUF1868 domain-containing protein n=1 Tax=Candidatus Roizmanbacteria bacterium RIFOXYD1_FULL_38_12 TaxID=1802093 RepID=A0A1F7L0A6_9BACT|nr:MAG: hypothetical protein A3K47_02100 [Candidatus Roizmanbacteria bacterium RIFOXYA2_FULL_38_14]OGK63570.1 MAG: hypothetical protein A3K27_02100 [Candidatus Roizmanbacteria bacterium RIFOXYA1_FULL_37_12]OGK65416.1 MAG: hypothetical protein A3K38_02100 [Candidatus Roizmanbacteria bacterium RIFOXYB1_FULL_40_23]OGK69107.1 MAG: hypothetical protein A2334_02900 [Candidatus Roizmanbacteria bacterium RIFOXYB2_FULL_38_10]OGK69821.1 MAG: hypothetical protein A3K21_02105 [Candidatus Roizmanbacteria ba
MTNHQSKQRKIIDDIERQILSSSLKFSTVSPVTDYENDTRIGLTGVHLPHQNLLKQIHNSLIIPIQKIAPNLYYYSPDSLHFTIKGIRVVNDPPRFDEKIKQTAKDVFARVVPFHHSFKVFLYKLIIFPHNLALVGTTEDKLDNLILDLDKALHEKGIPDDKVYTNNKYFFINMTLARFQERPTSHFINEVHNLSDTMQFMPYIIDSVTLASCNAVFKKREIIESWSLLPLSNSK